MQKDEDKIDLGIQTFRDYSQAAAIFVTLSIFSGKKNTSRLDHVSSKPWPKGEWNC